MHNLSPETLDTIAALGFDIYQSNGPHWQSYAYFTDGENIGYIENSRLRGLCLSTVHVPNRTTGTGFAMTGDRDTVTLTREYLSQTFVHAPVWASGGDRASVTKWKSFEAFLKSQSAGLVLVRRAKETQA